MNQIAATQGGGNEFVRRLLLEHQLVDEDALRRADEARVARPDIGLVEAMLNLGVLDEKRFLTAMGSILGLEVLHELQVDDIDLELVRGLPITYAKQAYVLPLRREDARVVVAMSNPLDLSARDDLRVLLRARVSPVLAPREAV